MVLPGWIGAYIVLHMQSPLHVSKILQYMTDAGWSPFSGKTPLQSLRGVLYGKSKQSPAYFQNLGKDIWTLTTWGREHVPNPAQEILNSTRQLDTVSSIEQLQQNIEQFVLLAMGQKSWGIEAFVSSRVVIFDEVNGHFAPMSYVRFNRLVLESSTEPDVEDIEALIGTTFQRHPTIESRFLHWISNWFGEYAVSKSVSAKVFLCIASNHVVPIDVQSTPFQHAWDLSVVQQYCIQHFGGWVWDAQRIEVLHHAWKAFSQRFVILSGLSGSGKSQMLWQYTDAVLSYLNIDPTEHRRWLPVQSNYYDPTQLFGYLSVLNFPKSYVKGLLTDFLIQAHQNPTQPYFLLLDEVNLAKIEDYLSPLLSAMEVDAPIVLHTEFQDVDGVPPSIPQYPSNLFIGATMNVDGTSTKPSVRVLDRAFIIEFSDIQVQSWLVQHASEYASWHSLILSMYDVLKNVRQHFGYRTLRGIFDYVQICSNADRLPTEYWDYVICSKVLSKINASRRTGEQHLIALKELFQRHSLTVSEAKIDQMLQQYRQTGFAEFLL